MLKRFATWVRSEEGQAMSEYGLVLAIAVVGVIAVLITFRKQIATMFTNLTQEVSTATTTTPAAPTTTN